MSFKAVLDTRNFNRVWKPYLKFQKRLPEDIVDAKEFFIARNATQTTPSTTFSKIEAELTADSKTYPDVPLAAIIINSQLGKKGKKGLFGDKMKKAVEKLLKKRKQSINFIRSGWKNAIKLLEGALRSRGELTWANRNGKGSKADSATMRKKTPPSFGGAIPARNYGGKAVGEISNNVHGDNKPTLDAIKQRGLQLALDMEVRSMENYIAKKVNPRHADFQR
jgi:hypothetical protein